MESIRGLKKRLNSIKSTAQITKSMRLISTTKVKKASMRMAENIPFFQASLASMSMLLRFADLKDHVYIAPSEVGRSAIIVISSDRGLCGPYNSNICKEANTRLKREPSATCITIGHKAREFFRRRGVPIEHAFGGSSETAFYDDAEEIGKLALELYRSGKVDKVLLTYSQFESILVQAPKTIQLLPISFQEKDPREDPGLRAMNFEPSMVKLLEYAVPIHVNACIHSALLSASASEQGARLMSMDAAEKNCGEMLEKLTLQFNRLRQGKITQELTEIVGGAEVLNESDENEE